MMKRKNTPVKEAPDKSGQPTREQFRSEEKENKKPRLSIPKSIVCALIFAAILELIFQHANQETGGTIKLQNLNGGADITVRNNTKTIDYHTISAPPLVSMYGSHRVQRCLKRLPIWLQQYVKWHSMQRLMAKNDPNYKIKYVVMHCLKGSVCGGLSDRLRMLPYYLLLSNLSDAVLVIKWTKPYDLREFLAPPLGGLDWTPTPEIDDVVRVSSRTWERNNVAYFNFDTCGACATSSGCEDSRGRICTDYIVQKIKESSKRIHLLEHGRSSHIFNKGNYLFQEHSYKDSMPAIIKSDFIDMFGDIFRVLFEPVRSLANSINKVMKEYELVEDQYISVHVRSKYPDKRLHENMTDKNGHLDFSNPNVKNYIVQISRNALNCAHELSSKLPIFLATDSIDTSAYLLREIHRNNTFRVVSIARDSEPLHIDQDFLNSAEPKDYFSTFEDILLMGGSKCVVSDKGSYGSFGSGLIGNKCKVVHRDHRGYRLKCPNFYGTRPYIKINTSMPVEFYERSLTY